MSFERGMYNNIGATFRQIIQNGNIGGLIHFLEHNRNWWNDHANMGYDSDDDDNEDFVEIERSICLIGKHPDAHSSMLMLDVLEHSYIGETFGTEPLYRIVIGGAILSNNNELLHAVADKALAIRRIQTGFSQVQIDWRTPFELAIDNDRLPALQFILPKLRQQLRQVTADIDYNTLIRRSIFTLYEHGYYNSFRYLYEQHHLHPRIVEDMREHANYMDIFKIVAPEVIQNRWRINEYLGYREETKLSLRERRRYDILPLQMPAREDLVTTRITRSMPNSEHKTPKDSRIPLSPVTRNIKLLVKEVCQTTTKNISDDFI
jgi:hypothetical protein